ncbi:hypothetical protein B0H10DRAFT_2024295 [Mycena sp. CBHHK59/15]|nr:hypothetical protein B0H10DRAFT_2024295 [Mycena sp. CBHHK59/15]
MTTADPTLGRHLLPFTLNELDPLKTSWEAVIQQLETLNHNHRDSSGVRKFLSRVRCLVDALRPFFGSVDTIVAANSQIAGLIWGALRIIIEVCLLGVIFSVYSNQCR